MKISILAFFLVFQSFTLAQSVQIIKRGSVLTTDRSEAFSFIENQMDTSKLIYVATLRATGKDKKESLHTLFYFLRDKAKKMDANSYKFISYNDSLKILTADVYFASDTLLKEIAAQHEKNTVYIFCNEKASAGTYNFKVNKIRKTISSGTYYRHVNNQDEEVEINKGGFTGMTVWIKWMENKPSTFLSLTGFGIADPAPYPGVGPGVGVAFNTGKLSYIDSDLGYLLVSLLKESN